MEIIQKYPEAVSVLQDYNLGCLGCIAASGESIEQGLNAHGINVDEAVDKMNKTLINKKPK